MLRAVTLMVFALSLTACDELNPPARKLISKEPPSQSASAKTLNAENLAGAWVATRETCELDSEDEPTTDVPAATLIISGEGHYRKVEGGREVRGSYTSIESGHRKTVQLDDSGYLSRYELVEGHLENCGEGDAVYQCAVVFQRAPAAAH